MWWKFNLYERRHHIAKSSRALPQRDRVRLEHTVPRRPRLAHADTEYIITADQGLFGPSDHARECQPILHNYLLRMRVLFQSGGVHF